ncbi:AIR synthase [Metallosphaera tengchongensis]|uniref:AIR synthase n=1 Tax=Metallosphaera tengchongensis TaxID=1532350 RepID=A0A6N0NSM0_9CREN|nr:AIR synthase-related protein [Metallosphaera tengchongensis]QKQ99735.1 AIR synthase [Metallosphaera tengchongensis]
MDLEGLARKMLEKGIERNIVRQRLIEWLEFYKGKRNLNSSVAEHVIKEVENSMMFSNLGFSKVGLSAGDGGLGSRGLGDNIIHLKLFELSKRAIESFDDAGVSGDIIVSVDGIHSRLSFFPYLAGFHATKATLRDIMVKGADPIGLMVDIHLSDDSDISMLFDFEAGVSTVAEAIGVPILAGSTLRIGGDLVLGERISGGIASVGKLRGQVLSRSRISKGNKIIMTEGNGGGTISAMGIFHGIDGIVEETLKIKDLEACMAVKDLEKYIVSMTDVTNGGIRADALEIAEVTNLSLVIDEEAFLSLINPKVRSALEELGLDPFGLSVDSILIFTNEPDKILEALKNHGIKADVIGEVQSGKSYPIVTKAGKEMRPSFRESPYTPVKSIIGNTSPFSLDQIREKVQEAFLQAQKKKEKVLKNLKTGTG